MSFNTKVKDLNIWGTDTQEIIKYGKKYSLYSKIVYLSDIIITTLVLHYMFVNHVMFGDYVKFMLTTFVVCGFLLNVPLDESRYLTYKFICKNGNLIVSSEDIYLTSEDLYKYLYKTYKSKLKKNDSISNYLELANTCCQSDKNFSSKFMSNLYGLKKSTIGTKFKVYYLISDRKMYFLKADEIIESESSEI